MGRAENHYTSAIWGTCDRCGDHILFKKINGAFERPYVKQADYSTIDIYEISDLYTTDDEHASMSHRFRDKHLFELCENCHNELMAFLKGNQNGED